jgi:glycosyltransferase involved in cell wall biosynthesis
MVHPTAEQGYHCPAVGTDEVFDWFVDADIGLLSYEDYDDINVRYCARQKLVDYVACGLPFIGSCRPSIEAIANEVGCGLCIDMTDGAAIAAAVRALGSDGTLRSVMAAGARETHVEKYNYERYVAPICSGICTPVYS